MPTLLKDRTTNTEYKLVDTQGGTNNAYGDIKVSFTKQTGIYFSFYRSWWPIDIQVNQTCCDSPHCTALHHHTTPLHHHTPPHRTKQIFDPCYVQLGKQIKKAHFGGAYTTKPGGGLMLVVWESGGVRKLKPTQVWPRLLATESYDPAQYGGVRYVQDELETATKQQIVEGLNGLKLEFALLEDDGDGEDDEQIKQKERQQRREVLRKQQELREQQEQEAQEQKEKEAQQAKEARRKTNAAAAEKRKQKLQQKKLKSRRSTEKSRRKKVEAQAQGEDEAQGEDDAQGEDEAQDVQGGDKAQDEVEDEDEAQDEGEARKVAMRHNRRRGRGGGRGRGRGRRRDRAGRGRAGRTKRHHKRGRDNGGYDYGDGGYNDGGFHDSGGYEDGGYEDDGYEDSGQDDGGYDHSGYDGSEREGKARCQRGTYKRRRRFERRHRRSRGPPRQADGDGGGADLTPKTRRIRRLESRLGRSELQTHALFAEMRRRDREDHLRDMMRGPQDGAW